MGNSPNEKTRNMNDITEIKNTSPNASVENVSIENTNSQSSNQPKRCNKKLWIALSIVAAVVVAAVIVVVIIATKKKKDNSNKKKDISPIITTTIVTTSGPIDTSKPTNHPPPTTKPTSGPTNPLPTTKPTSGPTNPLPTTKPTSGPTYPPTTTKPTSGPTMPDPASPPPNEFNINTVPNELSRITVVQNSYDQTKLNNQNITTNFTRQSNYDIYIIKEEDPTEEEKSFYSKMYTGAISIASECIVNSGEKCVLNEMVDLSKIKQDK